jgi:hypothetical protein
VSNGHDKKKDLAKIIVSRMAGAAPQIDAVRSTKGEIKGFFTQDTLYRLRQAVADHEKAGTDTFAEARLAVILGLCDTYLQRHGSETDARAREKVEAVDRIQQQAMNEMRDWGRRQAQLRYVRDVKVGAADVRDRDKPEPADPADKTQRQRGWKGTQFISQGASVAAVSEATQLAQGKKHPNEKEGFNQATLDLIKQYGLTEGEVLAVKVYTADDYKYIGAANNPDAPWNAGKLEARVKQNQPDGYLDTDEGQRAVRQISEEGSLHGAMTIEAVKKLPPKEGWLYRGMRLTEAEFQKQYPDPVPDETLGQITSLATEEQAAQKFADGQGNAGNLAKNVSVMIYVHVETGRDIGDLSVFGRAEKEWLLLPGVVLVTDSVEELRNGAPGNPPAKRWVKITKHQK